MAKAASWRGASAGALLALAGTVVVSSCVGNIGPPRENPAGHRRGLRDRDRWYRQSDRRRRRHRGNDRDRHGRQRRGRRGRHGRLDGRGPVQWNRARPVAAAPPDDLRVQQHDPRSAGRHDQPGQRAARAGRQQAKSVRQRRRRAVAHRRPRREIPDRGGVDRGARDRERDRAREAAQLREQRDGRQRRGVRPHDRDRRWRRGPSGALSRRPRSTTWSRSTTTCARSRRRCTFASGVAAMVEAMLQVAGLPLPRRARRRPSPATPR